MLRKLRAFLTAGTVGACGGALFGVAVGVLNVLTGGPASDFGEVIPNAALLGGLCGIGFAGALTLYGRLSKGRGLGKGAAIGIGVLIAPLVMATIVSVAGPALSTYSVIDWLGLLTTYAGLGALGGWTVWKLAAAAEDPSEGGGASDELMPPSPLEEMPAQMEGRRGSPVL